MAIELAKKIITKVKEAQKLWDKATPEIKELFKRQHDAFLAKDLSIPIAEGFPHLYAAMEHGEEGVRKVLGEGVPSISPDGNIDSDGKYEKHDIGWVGAGIIFLKNLVEGKYDDLSLPPQEQGYKPTVIPNDATIAIIGDWGTGYWEDANTPAAKVANVVNNSIKPDIVIHLGDVYYYGSKSEVQDNFVNIIPTGKQGTYNLNSNHDMYSVAVPYFEAVKKSPFGNQGNTSYFALTNDDWLIVGLDTAYLSSSLDAFLLGSLAKHHALTGELIPNAQTEFLISMAQKAASENKKLIIMSHHNSFDGPGMTKETSVELLSKKTLWSQVSTLIEPYLKGEKAYWHWGHAHSGYALKEMDNIISRCVGYGAVPWGKGSDFYVGSNSNIEWFEDTPMPGKEPLTMNGLMSVVLNASTIIENFYTQTGTITYSATNGKIAVL